MCLHGEKYVQQNKRAQYFFAGLSMYFYPNYWWHLSLCTPQLSISHSEDGDEHYLKHKTFKYLLKRSKYLLFICNFVWTFFWVLISCNIIRYKGVFFFQNIYYLIKVNCLPCQQKIFHRKNTKFYKLHDWSPTIFFGWQNYNHYFHSNFKDSSSSISINQLIKIILKFLHI